MSASTRWLGWTTVVLVCHMSEQLLFGINELPRLKYAISLYDAHFTRPDVATVTLVAIVATTIFLAMFSLLKGGRAKFITLETLGLLSVSEVHHVVESIAARGYTPGLVTSLPYIATGVLLMRAAASEYRTDTVRAGLAPELAMPSTHG